MSENNYDQNDNNKQIDVDQILDKESAATRARFTKAEKKHYLDLNLSWGMLIVIGLATFGIAYALQQSPQSNLNSGYVILFALVSYLAALIIYNLGKILFGYISGYTLSRIEILGLEVVYGKETKTRYQIKDIFELHLNMTPRSKEENPSPKLMLLGGTITYAIFTGVLLGISFVPSIRTSVSLCLRYGTALGALLVFYEMFPCKLDTPNDMYLLIISSGEENTLAYNCYLRGLNADYTGEELPSDTFDTYDDSRIKPQTLLAVLHNQVALDDYQPALKTLDAMKKYEIYIQPNQMVEAMYEKIYLYLTHGRTTEAAKEILVLQHQEKNASDIYLSISAFRSDVLISGLLDNSLEEMNESIESFKKEVEFLGQTARVKKEIQLVNAGISRVKSVHPDWDVKPVDIKAE